MIQRIQSFLLVLALVGFVLLFLFPTATYEATDNAGNITTSELNLIKKSGPSEGSETGDLSKSAVHQNNILLMAMAIILGIGTLASIFMYKNRIRQMRVVSFLALVNLMYIGLMFLFTIPDAAENLQKMQLGNVETHYSVGTFVPLITIIFIVIAQRAIRRDEMKVRAADRIR